MRHGGVSDITAVVLAGGLGTRLRSVVADKPKVLAAIGGRPFLARLFDQLLDAGLGNAVICTGYRAAQVRQAFGDAYGALKLAYSEETRRLGTAGALKNAVSYFLSDTVLVLNGDSYCGADIAAFREWHVSVKSSASLVLTEVRDTGRYGKVETAPDGRIARFSEKGGSSGPGLINAGIYLFSKRFIFSIPTGRSVSLEHEMFPRWVTEGLFGYRSQAPFIDIGTPEDYAKAEFFLREC